VLLLLSWYVARTKPRREGATAALLKVRDVSTYLPLFAPHRSRPRDLEPLFPGYLFVRFDAEVPGDWLGVRSAYGISYFLGNTGAGDRMQPASVPDELIAEIGRRVARQSDALVGEQYRAGERVVIVGGAFDGLEAVFQCRSGAGRSRVLVELVSRLVPVSVESERLSKLAPAV
jgi:transcriptional antiterminator RfaH